MNSTTVGDLIKRLSMFPEESEIIFECRNDSERCEAHHAYYLSETLEYDKAGGRNVVRIVIDGETA